ncbi:MAG: ABC transporter ATP-binding protein [Anaerolineales bacterium]|nr:ABC transporter ATP-binding protein [Anaerolineales bacterium]
MADRPQPSQERRPHMGPGRGRGHGFIGRIEKARDSRQALKRLMGYFAPYKLQLGGVLAFIVIYTLLGLLGPYLMGQAIDQVIASSKDKAQLTRLALLMLAAYLGSSAFQAVSGFIMARVSQRALQEMRRQLFGHLQTLSLSFFDRNPAGELMSRLTNDIDAINTAVSQNITAIFSSLLGMLGILIAMFLLNFWLTLAALLVIPILFGFTGFIARFTRRGFRRLQKELGELNAVIEETISGQRVVTAFRRNQSAIQSFSSSNQAVYQAAVYANSYALLLMPLTGALGNLFIVVIAGFGAWLALMGLATVGTIAAFISYGQQFIQPLRQLGNIYNTIQAALAGAERVFEIIDTRPEISDAPEAVPLPRIQGDVHFEDVVFSYVEGVEVIKDMSLHAAPGQTVALVGPTGAGKTTITNLLTRFYDIDSGMIRIDGHDICRVQKDSLRRQLGLVLQDTFLFSSTVMENIRYGRLDATDEEVIRAAKMAEADYFIHQLPDGYQTELSERGGNLSQGQRQLLTIARAILADPAILILDEATSSVDTRTEMRIQQALLRLMQGRTSFVIAHRLSTIRDADDVLVVNDGQIIERGSFKELLAQKGFFHHLYMSQFKGHAI